MKKGILYWLATGFGLGLSPFASGTTGSLPGIGLAAILALVSWQWQLVACLILTALAVPLCEWAEDSLGRKDDGRIVADEYLTFPLCLIGVPWVAHPWLLAVAFVVNRVMDIIKPPPAFQAQELRGGLGIVADDFITASYSLAVVHAVCWVALR